MYNFIGQYASTIETYKRNEWQIINVYSNQNFPGSRIWKSGSKTMYFGQVSGDNLPCVKGLKIEFTCEVNQKGNRTYLNCVDWKYVKPENKSQIERYLIEKLNKKLRLITQPNIKSLVEQYGNRTLTLFKEKDTSTLLPHFKSPECLKRAIEILNNDSYYDEFCEFMIEQGVKFNQIRKIYDYFGYDSLNIIKTNPFLASEINGIGFTTCDNIAKNLNVAMDCKERIIAGTSFILDNQCLLKGDLYEPVNEIAQKTCTFLGIEPKKWQKVISEEIAKGKNSKFYVHANNIMLFKDNESESYTSYRINLLMKRFKPIDKVEETVSRINDSNRIKLSNNQLNAVINSLKSPISIITGGPGTGKTTIMKTIIQSYVELNSFSVTLLAPTGKAAARMSECTGYQASTIHSALNIRPDCETISHLKLGLVIVDETSMLDQNIMAKLLSAVQLNSTLIFIGDVDQLPSVGRGDVLNQLIKSGYIPVNRLNETFRQENGSLIIYNAKKINYGGKDLKFDEFFKFYEMKDNQYQRLIDIYLDKVKEYGVDQVALLCPLRKEKNDLNVVADKLNRILQDYINPKTIESVSSTIRNNEGQKIEFRVGDRIMCWKNHANGISNGDTGVIREISNIDGEVNFFIDWENGISNSFTIEYMKDVSLAYAMSIHKAQGAEFKCVILPILSEHRCPLFQRNLLYTGVTRARNECLIVGDMNAVNYCIDHKINGERKSFLALRLQKYKKEKEYE